jgi:hypothetical protein
VGHANAPRNEIVWLTALSVAVFALAFAAQGTFTAVVDLLPLSSNNHVEGPGEYEFARAEDAGARVSNRTPWRLTRDQSW